jgi:glyoxylase-like metal-dependent hydrolase (beta-lactamase superfamily II)
MEHTNHVYGYRRRSYRSRCPPAIGDNYLKAIAEITDKPVKYVVYSHSHADRIGAASMFPDNASYIAHADTAAQLRLANDSNRPIPTITFTDSYELQSGNQSLLLDYHGTVSYFLFTLP